MAVCLEQNYWDGGILDTLNQTTTGNGLSGPESTTESSTTLQSSAISEHSLIKGTPQAIRDFVMSSRQDSPVSPSAQRGRNSAQMILETCGRKRSDAFALYDHDMCCWKTPQDSLFPDISTGSLPTWPRAGMWGGGTAYQRAPLAPLTKGTAYGLLPTPIRNDALKPGRINHNDPRNGLVAAVIREELKTVPTPVKSDATGGYNPKWREKKGHSPGLKEIIPGRMNPQWREWLMDLPIGWSALQPLAMRKFRRWLRQHGKC